jgi:hypothetical protein
VRDGYATCLVGSERKEITGSPPRLREKENGKQKMEIAKKTGAVIAPDFCEESPESDGS